MHNASDRTADEQALHVLFQQMVVGWNRGDGEAFAVPFTEDADFIILNGTHLKTRQTIAATHQQLFETIFKGSQLEGFIKDIRFLCTDVALMQLHGRPRVPGQPALAPEQYSLQTMVLIRQADGWHITSFQNTLIQPEQARQ